MRLIDADVIDFSVIKDDFDRARAKIIIMGQPTVNVGYKRLNLYERISIMNCFLDWCQENDKEGIAVDMLDYLNQSGLLFR